MTNTLCTGTQVKCYGMSATLELHARGYDLHTVDELVSDVNTHLDHFDTLEQACAKTPGLIGRKYCFSIGVKLNDAGRKAVADSLMRDHGWTRVCIEKYSPHDIYPVIGNIEEDAEISRYWKISLYENETDASIAAALIQAKS